MAPEGKDKKRKAPLPAASSDAPPKKSKKQKTTEELLISAAQSSNTVPNLAPSTSQTIAESNLAVVTSKKSRKRAADFLSDNEEEVEGPTDQLKLPDAPSESKKKRAKQTTTEKTAKKDVPAAEVVPTSADPESTNSGKSKKAKKTKVDISEKLVTADKDQAAERSNKQKKKAVQKVLPNGDSLTADGVNGVLEHTNEEDVEVTTANEEPSTSMQAEAQRTVDKEMADEVATDDESDDAGAVLLAGFDSDGEDLGEDAGLDPAKMPDLDLDKKQRKKLRQAVRKGKTDERGSVYIGRIPHGFHENEMRQYFSQFGTITNLRLSRNRTTGASKHFAFIEFESNEVAKIVAQTMDNYLMFGHILKCKYAPAESLHPDVWNGANKRFKKVPFNKIEKRKLEAPKTKDQWTGKIAREQGKRAAKAERMKSMGYEYDLPQIQTVDEALEQKRLAQETEAKAIEPAAEAEEPTGAIAPQDGGSKDAATLVKEKKPKNSGRKEVVTDPIPDSVAEARVDVAEPKTRKKSQKVAQEATMPAVNGEAQTEAQTEALDKLSEPIKSTKSKKKDKKPATKAEDVVPAEAPSNPPKFAFHPDEMQELIQAQAKSKRPEKPRKTKTTEQAAVQKQLNAELNEAVEPLKQKAIESDTEIAATAAVLPTPGGGEKKTKIKTKRENGKSDVVAAEAVEAVGNQKKAKKAKKSAAL